MGYFRNALAGISWMGGLRLITRAVAFVSLVSLLITIVPFVNEYGVVGGAYSAIIRAILGLIIALYFTQKIFRNEKK